MDTTIIKNFRKNDTYLLRFAAIVLIINSHLEGYYPWSYMATGGSMGVALFFALSSFGLFISERNNPRPFTQWYTNRIKRIYPAIWIILVLLTLPYKLYMNALNTDNLLDYFGYFFYPPFWFLQVLMIYYLFIFPILKRYRPDLFYGLIMILCVLYAFVYMNELDLSQWSIEGNMFLKLVFYFMIFLFGVWLAQRQDKISYSGFFDWAMLFLSIFLIYGHKFLMYRNLACSFQFIQHILLFPFIYYFLKISRSDFIQKHIMGRPVIAQSVRYVSDMTLELYLVHLYAVIFVVRLNLLFPANIIVLLAVTFIMASFVKYLHSKLFVNSVQQT
jgi:peptidoglycan/LPS O-acetylase OafA/YrhL